MIYIFNKNKIISYILASSFVLMLFIFQDSIIPNKDIQLVKVSSNIMENTRNIKSEEKDNIIYEIYEK